MKYYETKSGKLFLFSDIAGKQSCQVHVVSDHIYISKTISQATLENSLANYNI